MKSLRLRDSCTQYSTKRDRYGDLKLTPVGSLLCMFRDISSLSRGINYREEDDIQGLFWFAPDSGIKQGDVVGINGLFYRIVKVIIGREHLTSNSVHFIKCQATLVRQIS